MPSARYVLRTRYAPDGARVVPLSGEPKRGVFNFKIYFKDETNYLVSQPLLKGEVAKSLAILTERYASLE